MDRALSYFDFKFLALIMCTGELKQVKSYWRGSHIVHLWLFFLGYNTCFLSPSAEVHGYSNALVQVVMISLSLSPSMAHWQTTQGKVVLHCLVQWGHYNQLQCNYTQFSTKNQNQLSMFISNSVDNSIGGWGIMCCFRNFKTCVLHLSSLCCMQHHIIVHHNNYAYNSCCAVFNCWFIFHTLLTGA